MAEACVIVGANMAGASAAETLRRSGYAGAITLLGAEPELPYERPPLSKEWLRGSTPTAKLHPRDAAFYAEQRITLRTGTRAVALDTARQVLTLEDGSTLPWDHLVLATGTVPRTLNIPGADLPGIHLLRTLADGRAIQAELQAGRRLVVIGAGFIGAEMAASARSMGLTVTVLEVLPVPLRRVLGDELGQIYADLHRAHGVDMRLGTGVAAFMGDDRVTAVLTDQGERIACDLVVVGVGVRPATDWLADSGVALENGVLTDQYCATNIPGVVAAGDVANWWHPLYGTRMRLEHFDNALKQGAAAARTLLGQREEYVPIPYFWSDQYDVHMQYLGYAATWDRIIYRGDVVGYDGSVWYMRGDVPQAALLLNRQREMVTARRLLAARAAVDSTGLADPNHDLRTLLA